MEDSKKKNRKVFKDLKSKALKQNPITFRVDSTMTIKYDNVPDSIQSMFWEVKRMFFYILEKRPDLASNLPYTVDISELEIKNVWTERATYIAIDNADGTLSISLNYKKVLSAMEESFEGVQATFLWVLFHEFRHKIQTKSELIKSVIHHGNWGKFNEFMQEKFNKSQDDIDHVFHELNPCEVDAHIFACEMTGLLFKGTLFDLTDDTLKLLE